MRQKLNLITLGTIDFEKSVKFFEKLGWKKSEMSVESLALFPLGGITLALHPRHELAADAQQPDTAAGFAGITFSINAKKESEVDAILVEVVKAGGTLVKPAQKVYWGGYSGYFKDLDGHLFEVAFNPFWELDEEDNLKIK